MKIKTMTTIELIYLRNWMTEIYTNGKGFIKVEPSELNLIRKKLEDLDYELLKRILEE